MHICRPPTISPALAEKSSGDISVFVRPRCFPRPNASMEKARRFLSLFRSCTLPALPAGCSKRTRALRKRNGWEWRQTLGCRGKGGGEASVALTLSLGGGGGGDRRTEWGRRRRKVALQFFFLFLPPSFIVPFPPPPIPPPPQEEEQPKAPFLLLPPLHKMHTRFLSSPSPSLHPRPFQLYCQGRGTEREGERDYKGTHTKRGRGEGSKIFTLSSPLLEKLRVVGVS